jgi:hypothetical protein
MMNSIKMQRSNNKTKESVKTHHNPPPPDQQHQRTRSPQPYLPTRLYNRPVHTQFPGPATQERFPRNLLALGDVRFATKGRLNSGSCPHPGFLRDTWQVKWLLGSRWWPLVGGVWLLSNNADDSDKLVAGQQRKSETSKFTHWICFLFNTFRRNFQNQTRIYSMTHLNLSSQAVAKCKHIAQGALLDILVVVGRRVV